MHQKDKQSLQSTNVFLSGIAILTCIIFVLFLLYFISLFILLPWPDALSIIYISIRDCLKTILTRTTWPFVALILGTEALAIVWYKIDTLKWRWGNNEFEFNSHSQTIKHENPGADYD